MGHTGNIQRGLLILLLSIFSCTPYTESSYEEVEIEIIIKDETLHTKALKPNESLISDVSLMFFDDCGGLVGSMFIKDSDRCTVRLLRNKEYDIYACANFGYDVKVDDVSLLEQVTYHMSYPDEYREGLPMSGELTGVIAGHDSMLVIPMQRLMAKIELKIDRSLLSEEVKMNVTGVVLKNCPKRVKVFSESHTESPHDCFTSGFKLNEYETSPLNTTVDKGLSREVYLYMLENMKGEMPSEITEDMACSYLEIHIEYISPDKISNKGPLIYRLYLGGSPDDINIQRNCLYRITVRPRDDGLNKDGWSVDVSGLTDI